MYGELRIALNNVASQFGQLTLQLEESGHTKARAVINNVKKLHEIDDFCAAHFFARNTESLIKHWRLTRRIMTTILLTLSLSVRRVMRAGIIRRSWRRKRHHHLDTLLRMWLSATNSASIFR